MWAGSRNDPCARHSEYQYAFIGADRPSGFNKQTECIWTACGYLHGTLASCLLPCFMQVVEEMLEVVEDLLTERPV